MDPILTVFVVFVSLYAFVTVSTYYKISVEEQQQQQQQAAAVSAAGGSGASSKKGGVGEIKSSASGTAVRRAAGGGGGDDDEGAEDGEEDDDAEDVDPEVSQKRALDKIRHKFPVHVKDADREVIAHPGLAIAYELGNKVPLDVPLSLTVPKFFEFTDLAQKAYGGSVREYLGDNGDRLMSIDEAMSVGSFDKSGRETIYCSIASYRDFECRETVQDLYERAAFPERIRVAVIDQRFDGTDDPCIPDESERRCGEDPEQWLCKYGHLIDNYVVDARLGVGPVFARHLGHRHYRGEYFAMQVDSHVRFVEHWDEDIVSQWKSANNEMAVLSTYLSDITGAIDPVTHESKHKTRPIMCASDYEGEGEYRHLRHGQQPEGIPYIKGEPTFHPFWAAGFSFSRGHFVIQVPYDQYLPMVFQGEEISMGLRGFTYGYDYYAPERGVSFHRYQSRDKEGKRKTVPHFWENAKVYRDVGRKAMMRLNAIIGMAHPSPHSWQHDEAKYYGLGRVRIPHEFFDLYGIDTLNQRVEHHLCQFVGQPMQKIFKPALRANRMGVDYSLINFRWKDPQPDVPDMRTDPRRYEVAKQAAAKAKAEKAAHNNPALRGQQHQQEAKVERQR